MLRLFIAIKQSAITRINQIKSLNELCAIRSELLALFGESNETKRIVVSALKYHRWETVLGCEIIKFLRFSKPIQLKLFTSLVGVDLEKEIQFTDEAWELDSIKLPLPLNQMDKEEFEFELPDCVLSSYLRHKFSNFDHYCNIVGNRLSDFNEGPYEYGIVGLNEGDVVFDCGANRGLFSAVASRYGCQVFAFEAIPDIIENYLSKTANMNKNIRVQNTAVWDKEETLDFSYNVSRLGASRIGIPTPEQMEIGNVQQLSIPAIPLDTFVERNGIKRVDFIKADVEGAERNMLRGATRILREFAPKLSICTYHLPDDPQVLRSIILDAQPEYQIVERFSKMYAYIP